jgi:PAS domain S-box-containing protein
MTPGAWHECIHPEDRERAILIKAKAIRLRARYQLEYRLQRKDGTYVFVEERGSFFAASDGQARRMLGTITNITERKSTEEHLREQARLLDLAHDAILVLDLDDTIQYWNSSAERLYGWTAEQALGRKAAELLRQDATVTDDVRKAVMNKEDWAGELTHLTREGQSVLVEARLTLVRDRQGNPKSILSINTDITERKKMETQFLRAQRMESIGVLASGIAHDLNNVFAPILMAGELLDADGPGTDRKQLHALIQNSAQRGADLVRQICAFCRGVEGRRTKVHIGTVISELESILVETFPKSIEIRVVLPKILWAVVADPTQLYQVLLNLCVNARDAMPNGGVLTLSAENATLLNPDEAGNPQARPTAYLRLIVSDTGTGIPDEIRERIFDPFFTTKELGKGTGLGLSTTLGIVKDHDGFINLYSETGKGTAFNIYLPALGISKTGPRKAVDLDLPRGNGELVMVVDDEASIRAIATQTLQSFGYKVIAAQNGAEALDLYGRNAGQIAAVIVDVMMPVMDGLTAIHAMRRMNPALKVIAASGLSPEAHGIQASNEAIKSFLLKPYSSQTLLNTLDEVIHNKKGNAA